MKKYFACGLAAAIMTAVAWRMLVGGPMAVTAWDVTPTPTPEPSLTTSDYVTQGEAYFEQEDYARAIAAFSEAIRLDPGLAAAYLDRGKAYNDQGEYALALADLSDYGRLAGSQADPAAHDLIEQLEAEQGLIAVEGWVTVAIMFNIVVGAEDESTVSQAPLLYYGEDTEVVPEECKECYTLIIPPTTEGVVHPADIVGSQFTLHSGPEHPYVMIGRPGPPAPTDIIQLVMARIPGLEVSYLREIIAPLEGETRSPVTCTVAALGNANLRGGPSTDFDIVGRQTSGASAEAIAKAIEPSLDFWYRLLEGGWIRSDLVNAPDECHDLPLEMLITANVTSAPSPGAALAPSAPETLEVPLAASDYVAQGEAYFEQGAYEQAIASCSEAIRLDPSLAVAYIRRGMAYYEQGEYGQAIADFDEAIRLEPENGWAYNERGMVYHAQGDYEQAIADFDEAIRLAPPDYAIAYNNRGAVYLAQRDYERAIADFDEAIRLTPSYANAYNNRGFAYLQLGEYAQAFADFDEAIRLDPTHAAAYGNRGFTYLVQGEYARAIADFDESIHLNPGVARTYLNRANAYFSQGDYAQAIADFDEAIRVDPEYVMAYRNRGRAYSELGEYERAIGNFSEAIRLDPRNPSAYYLRGYAYYQLGENDLALADLNEHVRLAGDRADPRARDMIAQIEAMQKQ